MLCNYYAPTDFDHVDEDPSMPAVDKLRRIAAAEVVAQPLVERGKTYDNSYWVRLPYTQGAECFFGLPDFPETLMVDYINVGDRALYGNGIGIRLLMAGIKYAVDRDPNVAEVHTGWARWGLVSALGKLLGKENIAVENAGIRYGWGGAHPIEELLVVSPPTPGEPYLVCDVVARIDRGIALAWPAPRYELPDPEAAE